MIRVGIGGWKFEPWRKTFYPKGLSQARGLGDANRALKTFVFSIKASRFATNRKLLADAGPSVKRFLESGITELKTKLGPILWQLAPYKKFNADDVGSFLALLPKSVDGVSFRHALEVRHESFCTPDFVTLARANNIAIVFADSDKYPAIHDVTADFVYARLMRAKASVKTGYAAAELKAWLEHARTWESGGTPGKGLSEPAKTTKRDVFVYMINGAKERA